MIGNVFSFQHRLYKNLNATAHNDLLVLTVLTQRLKQTLNNEYHVEFSRYLSLKNTHQPRNESGRDLLCDLERQHNGSHYNRIANNFTTCQREIRERCNNYTNEAIRSFCTNLTAAAAADSRRKDDGDFRHYTAFNKQLVFSEHFNLFDFITSLARDNKNASNHERNHQFDFIVLDFRSILNATTDMSADMRPLMILEQHELNKNIFTMHRALADHDAFEHWLLHRARLWQCGLLCWGIVGAIVLIVISLIFIISLSAGIAAR